MSYKGLMRRMLTLDWFENPDKNKYQNYFMRFRAVFKKPEDFINCFPDDIQNIAEEYYPILIEAFPNLLLKFNTSAAAKANLKFLVRYNNAKFTRYTELQKITMPDIFSNDVIQTNQLDSTAHGNQSDSSNQNTTSKSQNANSKFNNKYVGDKDQPIDDAMFKADKYAQDGSTNNVNNNVDASNTSRNDSSAHQKSRSEKMDTQYNVEMISRLLDIVQEPNAWLMKTILLQMAAPVPINFETKEDWRGDF